MAVEVQGCVRGCPRFSPRSIAATHIKSLKALSLLELVLTLTILVIIAAVAVPRFGLSATRYRADLATQRISADLQSARQAAQNTGTSQTVRFYPERDQYEIVGVIPLSGTNGDYWVKLDTDPYFADLTSAVFGSGSTLIFNGWGVPDHGGTICLTVGTEERTLLVDAETGTVEIQ